MKISLGFKIRSFIVTAIFFAGLSFGTIATAQERPYFIDLNTRTVTGFGSLGGGNTRVADVNEFGQVVGTSRTATGEDRAFITGPNGKGMIDLGTLGGNASSGDAINDMGQVAGFSYTSEGERRVFITGPNGRDMAEAPFGKEDIGRPLSINSDGIAINDMNNVGQVVGSYRYFGNFPVGFMSGPGGVGVTEPVGYNAEAVNNIGQVTGIHDLFRGRAFITEPDGVGIKDLDSLNPDPDYPPFNFQSTGVGINDAGQVVGWSHIQYPPSGGFEGFSYYRAFITGPDGAGITDLGTLGGDGSYGAAINDAGQVVGRSNLAGGDFDAFHAFVTGPNGEGMMDLNSLVDLPADGLILTSAYAINNAGQIIAAGIIPEPEIYALLLTGLVLVGFAGSRRTMG